MRSSGRLGKVPSPSIFPLVITLGRVSLGFQAELLPSGVFRYLSGELVVGVLRPLERLAEISLAFPILINLLDSKINFMILNGFKYITMFYYIVI